jgi:hypothetical protein
MDIEVSQSTGYAALLSRLQEGPVGGDFGLGTIVPIFADAGLLFEVQYHHDFSKVYRSDYLEVKNQAVCLFLGVRFDAL